MSIKEKILNRIGLTTIKKEPIQKNKAQNYSGGYGQYKATPIINMPFGGEKNWGEMGAAKNYKPVYTLLALRSWEMWLSSDIASSILRNYTLWSIGQGLRLQAHPETTVLSTEGIDLTKEQIKSFVNQTDARFKIHTNSRYSSFSRNDTLHTLAEEAQKNAKIAGDCLVILRYDQSTGLNADIVDGMSVETPPLTNAFHASAKDKNNKIVHGVEINARKTPIAYYVKQDDLSYIRIPARSRALNKTTAFLVYGNRYRVDYVRGLPLFSCVLETLMKLDRYKEAAVGSAEEVAKIAYQIVHGAGSTGKNPMSQNIAYARQKGITNVNLESDVNYDSDQLASKVAATTGKQVFNNTQESKIEAMEHKNELYFKDFWETNFNIICGAVGIPPEVALGRYENNFSSSRMAGKAWEYAMKIDRYKFSHVFYKPYYNVWLELEILTNKIQAPGYLTAMVDNNYMALESYKNCTFIGASIPHVDPVKEVVAQRLLLADQTTPLTTHNKACESLNTGDFEENATRNIAEILFYNEESGNEDKDIEKVEDKNND